MTGFGRPFDGGKTPASSPLLDLCMILGLREPAATKTVTFKMVQKVERFYVIQGPLNGVIQYPFTALLVLKQDNETVC